MFLILDAAACCLPLFILTCVRAFRFIFFGKDARKDSGIPAGNFRRHSHYAFVEFESESALHYCFARNNRDEFTVTTPNAGVVHLKFEERVPRGWGGRPQHPKQRKSTGQWQSQWQSQRGSIGNGPSSMAHYRLLLPFYLLLFFFGHAAVVVEVTPVGCLGTPFGRRALALAAHRG